MDDLSDTPSNPFLYSKASDLKYMSKVILIKKITSAPLDPLSTSCPLPLIKLVTICTVNGKDTGKYSFKYDFTEDFIYFDLQFRILLS